MNFEKHYYSLNEYFYKRFGSKVYKLALNASTTCPNRDGTKGNNGCIFCSNGGSGDFTPSKDISFEEQIIWAKNIIANKINKDNIKYIAYFQSFSNTYGDLEKLKMLYLKALSFDDIVGISIATRPDCINNEVIDMLRELNEIKPVIVELGLQTIHDETAKFLNRGYKLKDYDAAYEMLNSIGVNVVTHLILGIFNESVSDMLKSVEYVSSKCKENDGIKLHLLYVLEGTRLADIYKEKPFKIMDIDEYCSLLGTCLKVIPKHVVIHRITGDGPKKLLIEPKWTGDKKFVLNYIHKYFKDNEVFQGGF